MKVVAWIVIGSLFLGPGEEGEFVTRSFETWIELDPENDSSGPYQIERRLQVIDEPPRDDMETGAELVRTFEEARIWACVPEGGLLGAPSILASPLEDRVVVLMREEDTLVPRLLGPEYDCAPALANLETDLALSFWCPPEQADADDTWEIELEDLLETFMPGGNIFPPPEWVPDADAVFPRFVLPPLSVDLFHLTTSPEGEVEVRYAEAEEKHDPAVVKLAVSFEVTTECDVTEWMRNRQTESEVIKPAILECRLFCTWKGTGHVRWNAERHQIESVDLKGSLAVERETSIVQFWYGEYLVSEDWTGSFRVSASVEE